MRIREGEYLIVGGFAQSSRNKLVKYLEKQKDNHIGILDIPSKDDDSTTVSFLTSDIVANLGKYPKAGSIYGVKVEPLIRVIKDKRFKEIRIYQKFTEDQYDHLSEELKIFYSILKENGHTGIPYHIEVRNPQGSYTGYYKYLPKAEQDILCIKPEKNLEGIQYILGHEHGHAIYNRRTNTKTKNSWIKLYHSFVSVSEATEDDLEQILNEIYSAGSLKDYLKDTDETTKCIVRACLAYIKDVHKLDKHHLETALSIKEKIDDYWPISPLNFSERELVISEYSKKSPEEFFAEAYAFWLAERPLPKKIDNHLNSTLAKLVR